MGFLDFISDIPIVGDILGGGAKDAAEAQQKAAAQQLATQERLSQWGYGYPDWLTKALRGMTNRATMWEGPGVDKYVKALLGQKDAVTGAYDRYIRDIGRESPITAEYANYLRGAEEALRPGGLSYQAGAGGGFAERSLRETALGAATEEMKRKDLVSSQILTAALGRAAIAPTVERSIMEAGTYPFTATQEALSNALTLAQGQPSRAFTPPWPGIDPDLAQSSAIGSTLLQAAQSAGSLYGLSSAGAFKQSPSTVNFYGSQPSGGNTSWFDILRGGSGGVRTA